jgi:hypothetical protein
MYGQLNKLSAIWCVYAWYRQVNYLTTVGYGSSGKDGNYTTLELDVRGTVHHCIIHTEIANEMQQCIKIYYSMFI